MNVWRVDVPIVGYLSIQVEAADEEAAIEAAMSDERSLTEHTKEGNLIEWEMVRRVTRGNVCYAPLNDVSAELEE